jgi:hypothetical protein
MTRIITGVIALLVSAAPLVDAQIIQPVYRSRPVAWTSLSVGWFQQGNVCAQADTCWDFGGAPQFRATLELPVGNAATFGVAGTMARVPLIYSSSNVLVGACSGCDANANVTQLLANFRMGGAAGAGFHQVIDLSAGPTFYSNFRTTDGERLGAVGTVTDLSFGLGYGFGYSLSARTQVVLVQEWMLVLHERQPGSSENTTTQSNIRVGGRVALGER